MNYFVVTRKRALAVVHEDIKDVTQLRISRDPTVYTLRYSTFLFERLFPLFNCAVCRMAGWPMIPTASVSKSNEEVLLYRVMVNHLRGYGA